MIVTEVVLLLLDGVLAEPGVLGGVLLHHQGVRRQVLLLEDLQIAQLLPQLIVLLYLLRLALCTQLRLLLPRALGISPGSDPRQGEGVVNRIFTFSGGRGSPAHVVLTEVVEVAGILRVDCRAAALAFLVLRVAPAGPLVSGGGQQVLLEIEHVAALLRLLLVCCVEVAQQLVQFRRHLQLFALLAFALRLALFEGVLQKLVFEL